jgi:hypothetical protein
LYTQVSLLLYTTINTFLDPIILSDDVCEDAEPKTYSSNLAVNVAVNSLIETVAISNDLAAACYNAEGGNGSIIDIVPPHSPDPILLSSPQQNPGAQYTRELRSNI